MATLCTARCAFMSTSHKCVPETSAAFFFVAAPFIGIYLNVKILDVKDCRGPGAGVETARATARAREAPAPIHHPLPKANEKGRHRCRPSGCAGPQLDFPTQQFQGVAEVWVPFEESIAIGWE